MYLNVIIFYNVTVECYLKKKKYVNLTLFVIRRLMLSVIIFYFCSDTVLVVDKISAFMS